MSDCYEDLTLQSTSQLAEFAGSDAEFYNCRFEKIDFSALQDEGFFPGKRFIDCEFLGANLSNQNLLNSLFRSCHFNQSKLLGLNWCSARPPEDLKFIDCQMNLSVFQELDLEKTSFKGSSLREADFSRAKLQKALFEDCDLSGAVFNQADLRAASFRGAVGYFVDPSITQLKGTKVQMPEALSLLRALEIDVD